MEPLNAIFLGGVVVASILITYVIYFVTRDRVEIVDKEDEEIIEVEIDDMFSELEEELDEKPDDSSEEPTDIDSEDEENANDDNSDLTNTLDEERETIKNAILKLDPKNPEDWAYYGQKRQRPATTALEKQLGYHPDFHLLLEVWDSMDQTK